ncbi:hypothetical protein [Nostoc sp. NMS8]|uniref:hypothetical protein n=1 Tax=Nostoc sp. NMS8 TaxID=2815392 RepID=UPI0025DB9038|nr:hypothetical protein [Nostoc sp. NMS8]MBN3961463.1 hypothetical protein [Nostoc sp. NMS8]
MSQIQEFHQEAMDLAEMAQVAKLRGDFNAVILYLDELFSKYLMLIHDSHSIPKPAN